MKKSARKKKTKKAATAEQVAPAKVLSYPESKVYLLYCRSQPPLNRLFTSVIREICSYLFPGIYVICPNSDRLHIFDVRNEIWRSIKYPAKTHQTSGFLSLENGTIFVCGGLRQRDRGIEVPLKSAFTISLRGQVKKLQSMQYRRCSFGLVQFEQSIYVFGGNYTQESYTCEKFHLVTKKWEVLPPLKGLQGVRCLCVWRREIYIFGVNFGVIAAYNPLNSEVRRLPGWFNAYMKDPCTAFLKGEEVVMLSNSNGAIVVRDDGANLRVSAATSGIRRISSMHQIPAVWNGRVYLHQFSGCTAVDLRTLDEVKEYPFPKVE